jgi:hypothetical protein
VVSRWRATILTVEADATIPAAEKARFFVNASITLLKAIKAVERAKFEKQLTKLEQRHAELEHQRGLAS